MKVSQFIIILSLLSITVYGEGTNKNSLKNIENNKKEISLVDFQEVVKTKLPELRKNYIAVKKAQANLKGTKSAYDVTLTSSFQYYQTKQYSPGSTFNPDYSQGTVTSVALSNSIPQTGTGLKLGFDFTTAKTPGTNTLTNSSMEIEQYQPQIYLEVTQPLLYNAFGMLDRFAEKNVRLQLEIEKLQNIENDKALKTYYTKLYYNWLVYDEILSLLKTSVKNSQIIEAQVQRKLKARMVDNDDYQKARASRLYYQNQYEQYKLTYDKIVKELTRVIDINKYSPKIVVVTENFKNAKDIKYLNVDFSKTGNYKILSKQLNSLNYQYKISKNKLLPHFNLIGAVTQKSSKDNASQAFTELKDTDYYVGFRFSYPLGNHQAENDVDNISLSIEELETSLQITHDKYKVQLQSLTSSAISYEKQYEILKMQLKTLESQLRTEKIKYKNARLNLAYVIDTRNKITSAKISILGTQLNMIQVNLDYIDLVQ